MPFLADVLFIQTRTCRINIRSSTLRSKPEEPLMWWAVGPSGSGWQKPGYHTGPTGPIWSWGPSCAKEGRSSRKKASDLFLHWELFPLPRSLPGQKNEPPSGMI